MTLKEQGPSHPDWDKRKCGHRLDDGTYCLAWRRRLADGTQGTLCGNHARVTSPYFSKSRSYLLREDVQAKFENFKQATDQLDLKEELALFRAYLAKGLEKWQEEGELEFAEIHWVMDSIDRLSKLVQTIVTIRNSTALTMAEIQFLQLGMSQVLKKYVPTEALRSAVEDLYRLTSRGHNTLLAKNEKIIDGQVAEYDPKEGVDPKFHYIFNQHVT